MTRALPKRPKTGHEGSEKGAVFFPQVPIWERFCSLAPQEGSKTLPRTLKNPRNGACDRQISGILPRVSGRLKLPQLLSTSKTYLLPRRAFKGQGMWGGGAKICP